MANVLKVTPSEVNETAKAITNTRDNMEALLHDLNSRITSMISSDWISDAGRAYENQFVVLYNQVIRALDTIQQHANNLSQAANLYAENENEQTTAATNLDASSIF